ncbi:MAG: DUF4981 domain-containing protein [Anaerolineae bacterium]|nr:DUF4981 domain-containing protein [Anaerolineae bacterium]NUQ04539.1 hypothetical protein [Anaerolineae bacterium]
MPIANYPDLLGFLTGGERCNADAVQLAVATRPRVVRIGRPFEVIMLVQNATNVDVDVTMTLQLPLVDLKKQRERFVTKSNRLLVGIKPAEVGYIVLPASTLPDTAPGEYVITVEFAVKTLGAKPKRIRLTEGGGRFRPQDLPPENQELLEGLKDLSWVTSRKRLNAALEAPLNLLTGGVAKYTDFSPGWISLCRLSDYDDPRPLLHEVAERIQIETLPQLKRTNLYEPLLKVTLERFEDSGFPLREAEAVVIAKLLTLILEYATPKQNQHGHIAAREYNIAAMVERDPLDIERPRLPHWFRQFIRYAEKDERVFGRPAPVILGYLYEELIADAFDYAFALVEEASGEELGTPEEMVAYRERIVTALRSRQGMDFSLTYLPLIIGGAIRSDQIPLEGEHPSDVVRQIGKCLEERVFNSRDDERPIFELANEILARIGQRHGFTPTHL